ncbi:MAG: hypothetical protein U1F41_03865 [Burkholderiales bacterium]
MRKPLLLAAFLLICVASPARAQFCPGVSPWVFDDVLASDPFCGFITWMADNGITLGCVTIDANHRLYCPNDNVTRKQMAAFMNRLGNVRVEAVDTGPGLTGGPITNVGTINLATTQLLPTTACTNNQIARWNGSAWACSTDANSGGTVTSLTQGSGILLNPSPIVATGTIAADTAYLQRRVSTACAVGSSIRAIAADGSVTCQTDTNAGGTVTSVGTGTGLTGGPITSSGTVSIANGGVGNAQLANASVDVSKLDTTSTDARYFRQGGNAFGGVATLGTTDNNALEIKLNGVRVMRYEPNVNSPNVIAGHPNNGVGTFFAQTVGGGGDAGSTCTDPPSGITRSCGNWAMEAYATVAGGLANLASGNASSVAGGSYNTASGEDSTVAGGVFNIASNYGSTVGGGSRNIASGNRSTVGGGFSNTASGNFSFAAGSFAKTQTAGVSPTIHHGAFVFADNYIHEFHTSASNEFAVRATGGVRFVTAIDGSGNPTRTVKINGNGELDFGSQSRQMISLSGPALYGIGVQAETQYARTDGHFTWFKKGTHSDVQYDPGAGGEVLMSVSSTPGTGSGTTHTGTVRAIAFTVTSDRAAKQDFDEVDTAEVLAKVVATPVRTWAYRIDPDTRHIGMTGQDFRAAFGVGDSEKSIATVDADGVALAAIQGLNAKLEAAIVERDARIDAQSREIAELKRAVEVLMARTSPEGRVAAK